MEKVYEFLYNACCWESSAATMSIHKTERGANAAMESHKKEVKKNYDKMDDDYKKDFDWDYDKKWIVRETKLKD